MTAPATRYEIVAPLARGGMGEILLARRLGPAGFEKLVVLKRPLDSPGSQRLVAALIQEARLLARINHPNVCQVHDLEQAGDQFFFTMEYLEGLSMWALLAEPDEPARALDPRVACGLFEQACDGLDAIHAMRTREGGAGGVVHRDVSPGNLFVTERGVVKVLDLGIAKSSDSEERTPFGRIKGKLGYLSPEQAAGQPIDHRSDLFSLGLVLHDVARARRPPRHRLGPLAASELALGELPAPLAEVIRRAVALDPADRFATAGHMASALRDAGAALGGSRTPRELAAWLDAEYAPELARRRAIAERGAAPGPGAAGTQILSLRSASANGTTPLEVGPAAPPPRRTERLSTPTRERFTPTAGGELLRPRPARRGRAAAIAGVATIGVAIALAGWTMLRAPTVPGDRTASAAAPAPRAATATATPAWPTTPAPPSAATASAPPAATASAPPKLAASAPDARARTEPSPAVAAPSAAPAAHRLVTAGSAPGRPRKSPPRSDPVIAGQLTIDSRPFAVIRIAGRVLGPTPLWRIPLPPGRYEIHAALEDGREQYVTLKIEQGRERTVVLSWSPP